MYIVYGYKTMREPFKPRKYMEKAHNIYSMRPLYCPLLSGWGPQATKHSVVTTAGNSKQSIQNWDQFI